jgi:formylglycine-generating enzyme required for sulfatase activity/serine/threonine protein kinase
MGNWDFHCPNCFSEKTDEKRQCQHCGHDEGESSSPAALPLRTILNNQYVVGRVLGNPGGFGITYLCWDINLATLVAIKEFMPRDNAVRDTDRCSVVAHSGKDREFFEYGLKAFLAEARTVAGFDHPNIVKVRTYFEQNHTAYLVMNYYEGVSLAEYVRQKGGRLPEKAALGIMRFILDGLQHVHNSGYLHRDVKPANIYLTGKGQVILLDFGAARYAMGEHSRSLSVVVTPGFSPFEQYSTKGKQGSWTDIYASGATLYYMLTGNPPESAPDRVLSDTLAEPVQLLPDLHPGINKGIMLALCVKASDRPQNIEELKKILGAVQPDLKPVPKPELEPKPGPKPDPPAPHVPIWRRKKAIALGACLLLVLLAIVMYGNWGRSGVLVVEPNPEDAEVWVDGMYKGRGRLRMEDVSSGKRVVLAKRSGYADEEKPVEVRSGGVTNVSIHLMALQGTLKVVTEPSGAEISVNGIVKGKSPVDVKDIKPGTAKVRASMNTKEYAVREEQVNIEAGREPKVLEWTLTQSVPNIGDVWKDSVTGMEFMWVPGGSFDMGSPDTETERSGNEGRVHPVELDGFWLGRYEVTNAQYRKWKSDYSSGDYEGISLNGNTQPVVRVSWEEVREFAAWLGRQNGGKYTFRLPSEAQWEYSCRAGTKTARYWGDNPDQACQYANVADQTAKSHFTSWSIHNCSDGHKVTAPVGSFRPNRFELYDMLGNVWEWCEDVYIADIYNRSDKKNPIYGSGGSHRVFRGGSLGSAPDLVRCAGRGHYDPAYRNYSLGFRLLRMP